jgi:L-arabinose isomerase
MLEVCPMIRTATTAWVTAGGPHHTVLSTAVGREGIATLPNAR